MKWRVVIAFLIVLFAASLTLRNPQNLANAQNKQDLDQSVKLLNEQLKAAKKETADLRAAQQELVRKLSGSERAAAEHAVILTHRDEDLAAANKALAECREQNLDPKAQVELLTSKNVKLTQTVGEHETVVTSLALENAGIKKNI